MQLADYFAVLARRKWTVLVVLAVVIAVALGVASLKSTVYQASARVVIKPLPIGLPGTTSMNVDTEAERAESTPVATLVQEDLGTEESPAALLRNLDVSAAIGTEILVFTYEDGRAEFARDAANAFAQSYITYRRQQIIDDLTEAQGLIEERIEEANEQTAQLDKRLAQARRAGDSALVEDLEAERSVQLVRIGLLRDRLDDIEPETTARLAEGDVIEEAATPSSPASPDYKRTAVLAVVLGLLLGLGVAFTQDYLGRLSTTAR